MFPAPFPRQRRPATAPVLSRWIAIAALIGLPRAGAAANAGAGWNLVSKSLDVHLDADGALTLRSPISGQAWSSVVPPDSAVRVASAGSEQGGRALHARLSIGGEAWDLWMRTAEDRPTLDLVLSAPPGRSLPGNLDYPFPLRAPGADWRAVVPEKTGLLFRTADADDPRVLGRYLTYDGPGLSMPWYGLTDLSRGLMVLIETPDDSGMALGLSRNGSLRAFTAGPIWLPSLGTVRYPRRLRFTLFDSGGYVAMAKCYRRYLQDRGDFVTLRQKAAARPPVAGLIGALDVHLRGGDGDQRAIVEGLQALGARRLLVNSAASPETLAWMRARGCLVGSYRIYTDIHPPGDAEVGEIYSRGYPDDAYTLRDGGPVRGFAYSPTHPTTYRSSILQLPLVAELVPPLLHENGYQAIFLDVTTAMRLMEDYNPRHYLDRTADKEAREAILRYVADQGVAVGSENGEAWAAPDLDYLEGMTMPVRFGYMKGITIGNYWVKFDPNAEHRNIDLNERVRIPLWDLVFHDSVVSTWRWNFTPNRYSDPSCWGQLNLIQVLQGDMPILVLNRDMLDTEREGIARTCREVCAWSQKIGWDELVDNRALNADRTAQESRFSSGWAVTVNFSDKPFTRSGGTVVAPRSFATYRWED